LSARDKLYGHARELYKARGKVTHAAEPPSLKVVVDSFNLARRCYLKTIEQRETPIFSELESQWKCKA
ncbi:MAG: hypothetical protein AAFP00_05690, partial [Bacteroidota bacterium]